jgi:hypothetical protein
LKKATRDDEPDGLRQLLEGHVREDSDRNEAKSLAH